MNIVLYLPKHEEKEYKLPEIIQIDDDDDDNDMDDAIVEQINRRNKWENNDYVCRNIILNGMFDSLFDIYQNVEFGKELCDSLEAKYMTDDASSTNDSSNSLKSQNMYNKSFQVYYVTYVSEAYFVQGDNVAWWVESGATFHVCKDRCWFKTYESLNDGSILHMGNESIALVHRRGCVDLRFSSGKIVSLFNVLHVLSIRKNFVLSSILNNCGYKQVIESDKFVLFKHGHIHYKRMPDMSKDGLISAFDMDIENDLCDLHATPSLGNKKYFVTFIDDAARTDWGGKYMDTLYGIIHETTAPYTPQQNGISERKNSTLKEMVDSMLSYSRLSQGFWSEAMLTTSYLLNRVPNKRNMITPYEIWTKKKPNLNCLRFWGCRAVVRLSDLKLKTLGERDIECIFVGYAKHFKAFRFYVIEPNDSVLINLIIESMDAIFDENRFSSVPRQSQKSLINETGDIGGSVVPEEVTKEVVVQQPELELRKSKRNRTPKNFGPKFQLYLIEGTRDEVSDQHSYCFNVEDDPQDI
ncbi:zinc finger, CCHC-type containing protein [Tanacetum coccineum]|uniref:Zinc finger, CCHC-type containing protein n=1 Tax=Tanacetum coccineum TaxID=301880 RepID=A0ABQ5GGJ4_9ASTR